MKTMVRRVVVLLACCALTTAVTRWLVQAEVRACRGMACDFGRLRPGLAGFVADRRPVDGKRVLRQELPQALREAGVFYVERKGRFVHFVVLSTNWWDDPIQEFVYDSDGRPDAIPAIIKGKSANTYRIEQLPDSGDWYYWVHN